MFTGIITEIGKIEKIENIDNRRYITIKCKSMQIELVIGESIACNGICLTVTDFTASNITMEAMNQTIKTTTVSFWKIHTQIHLERALRLSDRLNGHIVQGHIDCTSHLIKKFKENNTLYLEFASDSPLIVPHGSIAIDGVSLTIANRSEGSFQVALIDHTAKFTFFESLNTGDHVNLEYDIVGKYIQNMVKTKDKTNITKDWLNENGFL